MQSQVNLFLMAVEKYLMQDVHGVLVMTLLQML